MGVTHFGILHWHDDHGNAVSRAFLQTATDLYPELDVVAADIPIHATQKDYKNAIDTLKRTGFRWFYGIGGPSDMAELISEAVKQGIAGTGEHVWIIYSSSKPFYEGLTLEKDSPLALPSQCL